MRSSQNQMLLSSHRRNDRAEIGKNFNKQWKWACLLELLERSCVDNSTTYKSHSVVLCLCVHEHLFSRADLINHRRLGLSFRIPFINCTSALRGVTDTTRKYYSDTPDWPHCNGCVSVSLMFAYDMQLCKSRIILKMKSLSLCCAKHRWCR